MFRSHAFGRITSFILITEGTMKHKSQSAKKLGFYIHAAAFIVGIVALTVINLIIGSPYWVLWVLLAWTIGISVHGWCVLRPAASAADQPAIRR
jgi:2TM domain-containing protein